MPAPKRPETSRHAVWIVGGLVALALGGWALDAALGALGELVKPNYLKDSSSVPALIEDKLGCSPCSVRRITILNDRVLVSVPSEDGEEWLGYEMSRLGVFRNKAPVFSRASSDPQFDPRDADWKQLDELTARSTEKDPNHAPPHMAELVPCASEPEKICIHVP